MSKYSNVFDPYRAEPKPEHWFGCGNGLDFPNLMRGFGFEMDLYDGFLDRFVYPYIVADSVEFQDWVLERLKSSTTQTVGNYIFSRYHDLTHWHPYGYNENENSYFFDRAFPILIEKMDRDAERNMPFSGSPAERKLLNSLTSLEIQWFYLGMIKVPSDEDVQEKFVIRRRPSDKAELTLLNFQNEVLAKYKCSLPSKDVDELFLKLIEIDRSGMWDSFTDFQTEDGSCWVMRLRYGRQQRALQGSSTLPPGGETIQKLIREMLRRANFGEAPVLFG